jgi:dihydroorotate dehydrogenase electron transfer subunit
MAVLVAGGVGVATLTALAEELRRKRHKVIALLGDQTAEHIVCEKELKRIGCRVSISTEDGSKGRKGLVTDLLKHLLRTKDYGPTTAVYACGPDPMSRAVSKIAAEHGIPCQVSLGDRMACGVGVCLGCPVKIRTKVASHESRVTSHEYKMACKDGPVFDAAEVIW